MFTYHIHHDVVSTGLSSHRTVTYGIQHYLIAEDQEGRRWAHLFEEISDSVEVPERMQALLKRVEAERPDPRHHPLWTRIEPTAGSPYETHVHQTITTGERRFKRALREDRLSRKEQQR